jgi:cysteinyl-tRNA synthetase
MPSELQVYNTLKRQKEVFTPLHPGHVGMYVCGPTVYYEVHLGNCRTFVSFDIMQRWFKYLGYKVRYVRNITDVGHLLDDGEDRILKASRLEQLEPMEVVQKYTLSFHEIMRIFNVQSPSIEPRATQHIIEQIEMVHRILDNGFAYISNGSVYFDTVKFAQATGLYGQLSGRVVEELISESREDLKNQDEKRHPSDFAIWMKASDEHIMRWNSPWSVGFPGWHLECSAMSTKYLGQTFDIHGGGNDLKFPHHENEIAQNFGACGCAPARYWLHTNMLLMNGRKMSKSEGNTISPEQLFTGDSHLISKGYSPMVVRFFMLQAHYGSPLDITDEALQAAEKGYRRLLEAANLAAKLEHPGGGSIGLLDQEISSLLDAVHNEMNDDFNTPKAMARLFELVPKVNSLGDGRLSWAELSSSTLDRLKHTIRGFVFEVFGLLDESSTGNQAILDGLMQLVIELRQQVRTNKDWTTSDKIRDTLSELGIQLKDSKEGTTWSLN